MATKLRFRSLGPLLGSLPRIVLQAGTGEDLARLDAGKLLLSLRIEDRDLSGDPSNPSLEDAYLVATSPSGQWAGFEGYVAIWLGAWTFVEPSDGWILYVADEHVSIVLQNGVWKTVTVS